MKKMKIYYLSFIVNIISFIVASFLCTFSFEYKIDSFCNQLISYVDSSFVDENKFPTVSITPKNSEVNLTELFSLVHYNMYVPSYSWNADSKIVLEEEINISIISQPTFWSTPYEIDGQLTYKLDYSAYYLKWQADYSDHGYDTFFYASQSLADYLCDVFECEEEGLIGRVLLFKDKNGDLKTAYLSNIIFDKYGLADYQTREKGFFALSYCLFDPRTKMDFNAKFDIQLKINPRGNSIVLTNCLNAYPFSDVNYSFKIYNPTTQLLEENHKLNMKFLEVNNNVINFTFIAIIFIFLAIINLILFFFKTKSEQTLFYSGLVCMAIFTIFGFILSFVYVYYLIGFFLIVFFLPDALYFAYNFLRTMKARKKNELSGADKPILNKEYYEIQI